MAEPSARASSAATFSSRAASVTAVGRPRATSAAKLGPDKIAGTALGAHSAMMSDMNLCVPASMPLAQTTSGVPAATAGASAVTTERIACAGTTSSSASARGGRGGIAGHGDGVVDPHAGQEQAFAFVRELLGVGGVMLPQRHVAAGARGRRSRARCPRRPLRRRRCA